MARTKNPSTGDSSSVPVVLVPSVSAFDFLEGAFAKSERSRLGGIVLVGACTVALAASMTMGALSSVAGAMSSANLEQAQRDLSTVSAQLGTLDSADGIPASQIRSHIQSRTAALSAAVGGEVDTVGLLQAINASAPSGVSVTGVTFTSAAKKAGQSKSTPAPSASSAKPAPKASSGPATNGTVSITGKATSFALLASWQTALSATKGLSGVDMTWTGGGSDVSVTVTATLTADALSARAHQLAATPPSATAATTTKTGGK